MRYWAIGFIIILLFIMRGNKKKFKTKIFKIFVFVSIMPLLIISISSLSTIIQTRQKNISELQTLAIENASEKTKNFLDEKMEMFNLVISGTPENITEIDTNNLNYLIDNLKESAGNVNEISFVDKNGFEITKKSDYGNIKLLNISKRDDFKNAIQDKNYFGPIQFTEQETTMRIASKIENKNRAIIGVITGTINLDSIKKIIGNIKLGNAGFVYLVDNNGRLIASSNNNFFKPGDSLKNIELVKSVILGNFHDGLDKEDEYINSLNDKVIFSGRPMGKTDWFVISEWPKNDAFSVINNILKQYITIIVFSFILIVILGILLSRQIVKPIETLKKGAEQISKGNLDHSIDIKTNDEFNELGQHFNKMIKALKENKKLKDEFVFIAAHELRTPVTAIKGYISMILGGTFGQVPQKINKNLAIINEANERLVQLVQDLLEIARSDSGKMKINLSPISISDNIKTTINELKSLSGKKRIKIKYTETGDEIKIKADAYKLKEVLSNIIGNAIKYTPGKGDIEISHEIKGQFLITHIKDHGMGMSEENIKKLFSKFYRIQTDKTADIKGTGLGLFICKEIIERMNGQIWVKSKEGQGSIFSFSLLIA